ncbi:hypothetical protein K7432_012261 [Basidiobolus ranarum]|uniref:BZIP domain-containing protein n=1 Tax=Basidiobolus ranarum TaxID=34480 RepID=A0ABR2VSI8_9FUNG
MNHLSMSGRDNPSKNIIPTSTRFLMECDEYKFTPSLNGVSESNPFEQSFQKNPYQLNTNSLMQRYSKSTDQEVSSFGQSYQDDDKGSGDENDDDEHPNSHKRKCSSNENDDEEEKRKKFLERNRMAASKCRQKKKMWMKELEVRSEEVTNRNKSLHMLVGQLKEEVMQLKGQLLAHRNCNCNVIQQYVQTSGHFALNPSNTRNPSMMGLPYYLGK